MRVRSLVAVCVALLAVVAGVVITQLAEDPVVVVGDAAAPGVGQPEPTQPEVREHKTSIKELHLQVFPDPLEERSEQVRIEESLIAECMTSAGFKYFDMSDARDRLARTMETRKTDPTFGYGIAVQIGVPYEDYPFLVTDTRNADYHQSLSPERAASYEEILLGDSGCTRDASAEMADSPASRIQQTFGEDIRALYARADSDPVVVDADLAWQQCMTENVGVADLTKALDELSEDLEKAVGRLDWASLPPRGSQELVDYAIANPDVDIIKGKQILDRKALNDLQAREVELRATDLSCWPAGHTQLREDILTNYQLDWVAENESRLQEVLER